MCTAPFPLEHGVAKKQVMVYFVATTVARELNGKEVLTHAVTRVVAKVLASATKETSPNLFSLSLLACLPLL